MTSITTDSINTRPSQRLVRRPFVGFVAGLALAGTLALGVHVAGEADSAPKPASHSATVGSQPSDGGCRVLYHGRC